MTAEFLDIDDGEVGIFCSILFGKKTLTAKLVAFKMNSAKGDVLWVARDLS
ncbi:MAG: hypothetical protein ACREFE_10300 [Limisphaerales bacterium]